MKVTRGIQTSTRNEWTVVADGGTPEKPAREWRVSWSWSHGSSRREWLVEVYISPPQHTSYWRRVAGHDVIAAVKEFESSTEERRGNWTTKTPA